MPKFMSEYLIPLTLAAVVGVLISTLVPISDPILSNFRSNGSLGAIIGVFVATAFVFKRPAVAFGALCIEAGAAFAFVLLALILLCLLIAISTAFHLNIDSVVSWLGKLLDTIADGGWTHLLNFAALVYFVLAAHMLYWRRA